jgi:hypothetical protein
MMFPRFHNRIGKACALVAATLIVPALAYAGNSQGQNNNNQGQNGGNYHVPDNSPGIVLIATTVGAVLLFGAMRRSRAKT